MDIIEHENIEITYFINPHMFFYKILEYNVNFVKFDREMEDYFHSEEKLTKNATESNYKNGEVFNFNLISFKFF